MRTGRHTVTDGRHESQRLRPTFLLDVQCPSTVSIASQPMRANSVGCKGIRWLHLILTADCGVRLHLRSTHPHFAMSQLHTLTGPNGNHETRCLVVILHGPNSPYHH